MGGRWVWLAAAVAAAATQQAAGNQQCMPGSVRTVALEFYTASVSTPVGCMYTPHSTSTPLPPTLPHPLLNPTTQVRNSHGVFLDRSAAPRFLGWLEERIAAVTMTPPSHGEVSVCGLGGRGQRGGGRVEHRGHLSHC